MSEEQFLPIAQNLVQYLLLITRNTGYSVEIRAQAMEVFMSCLDSLEMLTSTRREGIRVFVENALPPWLETIVGIINNNNTSTTVAAESSSIELKSRSIETVLKLRLLFPSQLVQYLPAIFKPVYDSLRTTDIYDNDHAKSTELQVEFLRKSVQAKIIVEEPLSDRSIFEGCIALSLKYAQITPAMSDDWTSDPDGFVEDLEDSAFSTRHLCTDLVEDLQKINPTWTQEILASAVSHYFSSEGATTSGDHHLTRQQEALVFVLSVLVARSPQSQGVLETALSSADPFLVGRGAIYAAQLGVGDCFETICGQLLSKDVVVRLCAIKALSKYADTQEALVRQHQARILEAITTDAQALPAASLLMSAEALSPIIHLNPAIVLSPSESPLPGLFTLLAGNPGDIALVSTVVDIFESLAGSVDFEALCHAVLPVLFRTISEEPTLRPIAFDILNGIIEGSDRALPDGFVDTIWPAFSIPLEIDEEQTVHEILRNLVRKAWPQIVAGTHVDELLHIIGTAFTTAGDESVSFYIPQLVTCLIRQSGDLLADMMPKLLDIIVEKLREPGLSTAYQQNLVSVFAELSITQAGPLVAFLTQREGGLERVMRTWCEVFPDFHGYASIRTSVVGLSQVYRSRHPALASLEVRGDLIPDTSGRILTRSRAKNNPDRYTMVPLPAKIVKLFLAELVNELEGKNEDGEEDEDLVSDDEWDSTDLNRIVEEAQLNESEFERVSEDEDDSLREVNTRSFILDFFRSMLANGAGEDARSLALILTPGEQEMLHAALQQQ